MEIILLSENKLKITLSSTDVTVLGFGDELKDSEKIKKSKAFIELLESARIKTGFCVNGSKLFVSIYRCSDSGVEMYITKCTKDKIIIKNSEKSEYVWYRFDTTEVLLLCCLYLFSSDYTKASSAFWNKDGGEYAYYLKLCQISSPYRRCVLSEFAENISNENDIAYILEHSSVICEKNAVEVLAKTAMSMI